MALALKWQKVARERRGGNPEVWWQLMNEMADGRCAHQPLYGKIGVPIQGLS